MSSSTEDIGDWNKIAGNFIEFAGPDSFIQRQFTAALWESLGDVRGLQILDLGCGPGWLSQQLHEAGAKVLGIDGSSELLKTAQTSYPDVDFLEYDLSQGLPAVGHKFSRIVANMVLMDIPDITTLMRSVREVLDEQGKFIFTMQHPCFFNMKSHYDEDKARMLRQQNFEDLIQYWQPFDAHAVVRVLSEYRNCIFDFGAIHSVYDAPDLFQQVSNALAPYPNVLLFLPSSDKDESVRILHDRGKSEALHLDQKTSEMWFRIIGAVCQTSFKQPACQAHHIHQRQIT